MKKITDFTLQDGYGNNFNLRESLKEANVFLFFYRGNW